MNLLFLVLCIVSVLHVISFPRNQQIKYSAKKLQTTYQCSHDPTALEVLEGRFLQPNKKQFRRHSYGKRRVLHQKKIFQSTVPPRPTSANITIKNIYHALNNDRLVFESCFASFGDQSPLCKTQPIQQKRHRRSRISFPFKKSVESESKYSLSTNEDFFGLFETSSETLKEESSKFPINKRIVTTHNVTNPDSPSIPTEILSSLSLEDTTSSFILNQTSSVTTFDSPHTISPVIPQSQSTTEMFQTEKDTIQYSTAGKSTYETVTSQILHSSDNVNQINGENPGSWTTMKYEKSENMPNIPHNSLINIKLYETNNNGGENVLAETEVSEVITAEETEQDITMESKYTSTHIPPGQPYKMRLDPSDDYSKEKCETDNNKVCVCSFERLKMYFSKLFSEVKYRKVAMNQISLYECGNFVPVPKQFTVSSNAIPNVPLAVHKPMVVDNENGPKEIDEKSMDDFIVQSVSEEDDQTHVFVNSDVEIPCFPTSDVHLSSSEADHVTYKWTIGNKKTITEGRITENFNGEGSLSITEVNDGDAENYTCEVEYIHPDTGLRTEETYEHVLNVVALPTVTVRLALHYRGSGACDPTVIHSFKLYMPQLLSDTFCKIAEDKYLCKVEVLSTACHTEESGERSVRRARIKKRIWPRQKRQDSMEMSINYEVLIHRVEEKSLSSENPSLCHAECHLTIMFKLLRLLKDSFTELVSIPVMSETLHGTEYYNPVQSSLKVKYIFGCLGGYHLQDGFCVACKEHTFSKDGDTECTPCPPHTYQGKLGARKCIPCTNHWIPACNEYIENTNIMIVVIVFVIVFIAVGVFTFVYYIRVKEKTFSDIRQKMHFPSRKKYKKMNSKKQTSKRVRFMNNDMNDTPNQSANVELQSLLESTSEDDMSQTIDTTSNKDTPKDITTEKNEKRVRTYAEVAGTKKNDTGKSKTVRIREPDVAAK